MGVEIERKFLLSSASWRHNAQGLRYRQAYLATDPDRTVRVRVVEVAPDQHQAWLTIKGRSNGPTRPEFEYPIPASDAETLISTLCFSPAIDKQRYLVEHDGDQWEIDEFSGDNAGLVVAEIELESENQVFTRPPWLGQEVTDDPRYTNSSLSQHPYSTWDLPDTI